MSSAILFGPVPPLPMIDQQTFEELLPLAYEWAKEQEAFVLAHGIALDALQAADARRAGVRDCGKVRILVVDRIPLPNDSRLAEATRRVRVLTEDTRCTGFGHVIIIRADAWGDRELLLHNLVHIAQCERSGGLQPWIREYLFNRTTSPDFSVGSLEEEARRVAQEICANGS